MKAKRLISILLSVVFLALVFSGCEIVRFDDNGNVVTTGAATSELRNDVPAAADDTNYAYQSLQTDFEREFYKTFGTYVMKDASEPFTFSYTDDLDLLVSIAEMYCCDHPEVFWLDDRATISTAASDTTTMEVTIGFKMSGSELQQAKTALESAVQTALAGLPESGSDYEKELYINDYLVDTAAYDMAAAASSAIAVGNEHTAYGALVDKKCVCDGFSTAFKLLADRAGLESSILFGSSTQRETANEYHAWNCVKVDGDWYHLDVTWNEGSDETIPAIGRYLNFNLTTEQALQERTLLPMKSEGARLTDSHLNNYFIPTCTATTYNYFEYNCDELTTQGDYDAIEKGIAEAAQNYAQYYYFRVGADLDYESTYNTLMSGELVQIIQAANSTGDVKLDYNAYVYSEPVSRVIILELSYQ